MRALAIGFVALTVIAIACSDDTSGENAKSPSLTDYDQTCTKDEDCARVYTGSPCGCSCDVGSVNQKDQSRYVADRRKVQCDRVVDCGACQEARAFCTSGKCAAENCPGTCPAKDASTD